MTKSSPEDGALSANFSARSDESVLSRSVIAVAFTSLAAGLICFQTSTGEAAASAAGAGALLANDTAVGPCVMSMLLAV